MRKEASNGSPWKSTLASSVDEYLASIPEEARATLERLRRTIKTAAPDAKEAIYYRIPTFIFLGPLIGFSASKDHCSLHLMSPSLMNAHREELKAYDTTTATIRFPFDAPLPDALVTMLVKERIIENENRARK